MDNYIYHQLIFKKDFWVFERKYKTENQSTRIINILQKLDLDNRFEPDDTIINEKKEVIFWTIQWYLK